MNAGQLAALIAAGFFAAGMCAVVYVLIRLARLITAATEVVTGYQAGADELIRRGHAAVSRADEQLARTGALTDSVEEVSTSMTELADQVSAVAGTARFISAGLGTPVLRLAAAGHGVRRALAIRRSRQVARRADARPPRILRDGPRPALIDRPGRDAAVRDGAGRNGAGR